MKNEIEKDDLLVCEPDSMHSVPKTEEVWLMPDEARVIEASVLFQTLSDSTRLKILWLLMHYEICVFDIAQTLSMSAPAVSHHLRSLRQMEIITFRRDGKHMYYTLADNNEAKMIRELVFDALDSK